MTTKMRLSLLLLLPCLACSPSERTDVSQTPDVVAADVVASDVVVSDVVASADVVAADVIAADVIAPGGACAFNRECNPAERCECDEINGCLCTPGVRGQGVLGEACVDGQDCASSICLQGPGDDLICSEECVSEDDCAEPLPLCSDIAFVGRICVRSGA